MQNNNKKNYIEKIHAVILKYKMQKKKKIVQNKIV